MAIVSIAWAPSRERYGAGHDEVGGTAPAGFVLTHRSPTAHRNANTQRKDPH